MKRHLLFPATAVALYAQLPGPGDTEKILLSQVNRYYQLIMDKRFREAEKLVAEDSKEDYYNGKKPDIQSVRIVRSTLSSDGQTAQVTLLAKIGVLALGSVQVFEIPTTTSWKLEQGEWRWYIDRKMAAKSPFGDLSGVGASRSVALQGGAEKTPDWASLMDSVTVERQEITLSTDSSVQRLLLRNKLPGEVRLRIASQSTKGVSVAFEKNPVEGGGATEVVVSLRDKEVQEGGTINLEVAPLGKIIPVNVRVQIRK